MTATRRKHTSERKLNAVHFVLNKKRQACDIADVLDKDRNTLYDHRLTDPQGILNARPLRSCIRYTKRK